MTSDSQEPVCWRAARPCPLSDSAQNQKLSCQAWFRCEMAGDYVIRWRCHSLDEGEVTITNNSLSLCSNQSDSKYFTECPPPVVCADDPSLDQTHLRHSDLSTDVVLAIAVSTFAVLAMLLIIVSSYKYWTLRKRLRQRMSRQCVIQDFTYPVRYHNMWGTGYHQFDHNSSKKSQSPKSFGSSHQDVYFSQPREPSSYFERLLSPLDDFMVNRKEYSGSGQSTPKRLFSNANKFTADPSVATGSFVFHQPIGGCGFGGFNGRVENWIHQNKLMDKEREENEKNQDRHKGNPTKFHVKERKHSQENGVNYTKEYKNLHKNSTDFNRVPQVSSIGIPTFQFGVPQNTMAQHEYLNPDFQAHEEIDEQFLKKRMHETNSSYDSVPHYALGFISRTENNQNYFINSEGRKTNSHLYQSVSSKCISGAHRATAHPSPDVISSHNFTNRFVRVGKNIYRPLHSSSFSSVDSSSRTNDKGDLSYDSFRNEHLRELAKRGAASSSTLEVCYKEKTPDRASALNNRY